MIEPYKPIPCAKHDEYELAVMRKQQINVKWLDEHGVLHSDKLIPEDILVKDKEEFLVARTRKNAELRIRLDKICLLE